MFHKRAGFQRPKKKKKKRIERGAVNSIHGFGGCGGGSGGAGKGKAVTAHPWATRSVVVCGGGAVFFRHLKKEGSSH